MTPDDRHARANAEQIRLLREELQRPAPHPWLAPVLVCIALAAVVALCVSIRGPLLPLILGGLVCVTVGSILAREGWAVLPRWAAGVAAGLGVVMFLAF